LLSDPEHGQHLIQCDAGLGGCMKGNLDEYEWRHRPLSGQIQGEGLIPVPTWFRYAASILIDSTESMIAGGEHERVSIRLSLHCDLTERTEGVPMKVACLRHGPDDQATPHRDRLDERLIRLVAQPVIIGAEHRLADGPGSDE